MKLLFALIFALPIMAQQITIVLPYSAPLLKHIQGRDVQVQRTVAVVTPKTCTDLQGKTYDCPTTTYELRTVTEFERVRTARELAWGDPAIERAGVSNRRMAFSHALADDETTGLKRDGDVRWLAKRLLEVARDRGICLPADSNAQCIAKIDAYVDVRRNGLPANWRPPLAP